MKKWTWAFILIGLGIAVLLFPLFVSSEIENAFDVLNTKLGDAFIKSDSLVKIQHENLLLEFQSNDNIKPSFKAEIITEAKGIHDSYISLIKELDVHIAYLSLLKKSSKMNHEDNSSTLVYWMGTETESKEGRGNGNARKVREEINKFRLRIIEANKKIAVELKKNIFYQPMILKDIQEGGKKMSWEKNTFQSPIFNNLSQLQSLKLDQAEVYRNELNFFSEVITNLEDGYEDKN